MRNTFIFLVVLLLLAGGLIAYRQTHPTVVATFQCAGDKAITATFYSKDDTHVDLILSDSRALSIPHTVSASGARYATADESFVFWNKGDTAFITENGTTTYADCTAS